MTHQQFTVHLALHPRKDFCDGILAFGLFAEHILCAWPVGQTDRGDAGAFLTAVVLLLHHQIEFVETIGPCAVFLLVVVERFQQTNHRHTAFVFQLLNHLAQRFEGNRRWLSRGRGSKGCFRCKP